MWGDDRRTTYRISYQPNQPVSETTTFLGLKFSNKEKQHLLFAIGALTLAFTLYWNYHRPEMGLPVIIGMSFVAVITGFLLHELGHKYVAQRYGSWAEFRAWPIGLLLAVVTGFMGSLFAAPGAVYHKGHLTKDQSGKVSVAGPVMNVAVATPLIPILLFVPLAIQIWSLLWTICFLNVFIGGFNMIPFPPLDGSKIIKWNPAIWVGILALLGFYFVLLAYPSIIFGFL